MKYRNLETGLSSMESVPPPSDSRVVLGGFRRGVAMHPRDTRLYSERPNRDERHHGLALEGFLFRLCAHTFSRE